MSKQKKGFGRAGLSGLATTTLVIGACAAFAAPANAAAGDVTVSPQPVPTVIQGGTNQAGGDVTYEFANNFANNDSVSFSIAGNDCTTQSGAAGVGGIDRATGFASAPTVSISRASSTDTERIPTYTETLSSSGVCGNAGIKDIVTITLTQPADTVNANQLLDLKLSNVAYNVGVSAPTGSLQLNLAGPLVTTNTANPNPVTDARIINNNFVFVPRKSAQPGTTANDLGTATFTESTAGSYFPAGQVTRVDLQLSGDTFTPGVVPTIQVPSGYTVYKDNGTTQGTPATQSAAAPAPATTGTDTYTFYVKAPATATKAVVTVSGLEADTSDNNIQLDTITPTVGGVPGDAVKALNVVSRERVGGSDRYATAANLFDYEFGGSCRSLGGIPQPSGGSVVLSGGELFPDALSANYLASEHNTGTLLTRANSLPQVTKNILINDGIKTVYITGQTAAVSQAVEDQIAALHQCGSELLPNISVVRLGGKDRYATNATINRDNVQQANDKTAILAAGTAPYDSLSVGPVVYANTYPLVLTDGSSLGHDEEGQFQDLGVKNVVVVGGEAVVSKAVTDKLTADGYKVIRLAGPTRFDTSATIAKWASEGIDQNGNGSFADTGDVAPPTRTLNSSETAIANGTEFPDALVGGPVAGDEREPLVLAQDSATPGPALAGYLGDKTLGTTNDGTHVGSLFGLGLTAAVSNSLLDQAAADIEK